MAAKGSKRIVSAVMGAIAMAAAWAALAELGLDAVIGAVASDWYWLAIALGAVLGTVGREGIPATVGAAALALMLAVEWLPGPATLGRRTIRTDPLPKKPVDAVVVLSAALTDDGRLTSIATDRLLEGARLIRSGVSRRLVLSRVDTDIDGKRVTSDADQRAILALAGLEPELHILAPVGTTRIEAVRMEELANRHGWRSVVVVTSPSHTKRACAAFEGVGLTVTCRPAPDRSVAWSQLDSPGDRTRAFGQWLYETLGWWEYRARGWIKST